MGLSLSWMIRLGLSILIGLVSVIFVNLYRVRARFRSLQRQGLPMLPHSFLFGHIRVIADIVHSLAPSAYGAYLGDAIRERYPSMDEAFYIDMWPIDKPLLLVLDPDMFYQFTQAKQVPKDPRLRSFMRPISGGPNLLTMEGPSWKRSRSIFNSAFSTSHVSSLVPGMVDKTIIFVKKFDKKAASGKMFCLQEMTLNFSLDIIGGALLDHDFQSQSTYNDMTSALGSQIKLSSARFERDLFRRITIARPIIQIYNTWRMNRYLKPLLESRYESVLSKKSNLGKSIAGLALETYFTENPLAKSIPTAVKKTIMAQIKFFIFAGHDTTSTTAIFTYHLLSKHPGALARIRAEHDAVLGSIIDDASSMLMSKPHLLNQLSYTLAVIKEASRIYPPFTTIRLGQPGFSLISPSGQEFPTENCLIWGDHFGTHHNPSVWSDPDRFLPERWLVEEGDLLYPPKNAWRSFERGPRQCMGMELALTKIKVILALTIRKFDIKDAYEEFDLLKNNPKGMSVKGTRVYMNRGSGAGHPADGYPCTVGLSGWGRKADLEMSQKL